MVIRFGEQTRSQLYEQTRSQLYKEVTYRPLIVEAPRSRAKTPRANRNPLPSKTELLNCYHLAHGANTR